MVSRRLSYIWGVISGGFLLLVSLFPDEIRKLISSAFGISSEVFVFYALIALAVIGIVFSVVILIADLRKKPDVLIQEDSLRFNKYPYLIVDSLKRVGKMSNTVYSEITVENCGKVKAEKCLVEITLKGKKGYASKVLSSDSTDASNPNPMSISVDAHRGTKGFHPLCLRLLTFEAFLPNHSLGRAGAFDGTLVEHGEYEMFGRVLYDDKQRKIVSLGKVKIPDDFLEKAKIPNDILVRIDQGGFAVFVERNQDKIRAKFFGHNGDDDVRKLFSEYLEKIPQIDDIMEDKGELRNWRKITPTSGLSIVNTSSLHYEPKLAHVRGRLFYPSNVRERDPKKNNPRHKLILVTDLRKAYYVGAYAWDLVIKDKIEWLSEDDQDLEEWCKKEGYTLIKQEATEDNLLEPYFYAEIVDKKAKYRQGETVLFRAHYRGESINGFFDNEIVFPNGRTRDWRWAPDTLINDHPSTPGNLSGYVNHQSPPWGWIIPMNAPVGEYKVYMRIYNHYGANNRQPIAQKEDTFTVV